MEDLSFIIREIDAEMAKLSEEERRTSSYVWPKRSANVEPSKALSVIRNSVDYFISLDDVFTERKNDKSKWDFMVLSMVSWFVYLKKNYYKSREYNEARNIIVEMSKKDPILEDWCGRLVTKHFPLTPLTLWDVELNVSKTNELIVTDDVKIVVDATKACDIINFDIVFGSDEYKNMEFEYKVYVGDKEYSCLYHIVDYVSKCECPVECPYHVLLNYFEKNADGECILKFDILGF